MLILPYVLQLLQPIWIKNEILFAWHQLPWHLVFRNTWQVCCVKSTWVLKRRTSCSWDGGKLAFPSVFLRTPVVHKSQDRNFSYQIFYAEHEGTLYFNILKDVRKIFSTSFNFFNKLRIHVERLSFFLSYF